jgi:hypothetical protein
MVDIGWKLQLTKMWHRALASYLRAVASILGTGALVNAATGAIDLTAAAAIGWSLIGALIAPLIVFITEAADLLDGKAVANQPDPPADPPVDQ